MPIGLKRSTRPFYVLLWFGTCRVYPDYSLQWRHNEGDGVQNHQTHDCLLNRLFRRRSKKTSKLRITGLCAGNSPVAGEFPAQMASSAENVSIWWRHHHVIMSTLWLIQQWAITVHRWTPFYFMYEAKCFMTFPWCTINTPATFVWCAINAPEVFAWCTNHFVHKVEFSHIGWNGVHPLCISSQNTDSVNTILDGIHKNINSLKVGPLKISSLKGKMIQSFIG